MKHTTLLRRAGAILLALCLTLSTAALAAEYNNMANFQKTNTYTAFSDVPTDAWYASAVQTAVELGIMNGKTTDTFAPTGNLSLAEALTMACRVYSIYSGEAFTPGGKPWYQNAVDFAVKQGVLLSADEYKDYTQPATRADMAMIFGLALPTVEYQRINRVGAIQDVDVNTDFATYIHFLYSAGVVSGDSGTGKFRPTDTVTRAEAAVIIGRIALPETRQTITLPAPTLTGRKAVATLDGQMNVTIPNAWTSETRTAEDGINVLTCESVEGDAVLQITSYVKANLPDYDLETFAQACLGLDQQDYGAATISQTEPDFIIHHGIMGYAYTVQPSTGIYLDTTIVENSGYYFVIVEGSQDNVTLQSSYDQLIEASFSIDPAL